MNEERLLRKSNMEDRFLGKMKDVKMLLWK